MAGEGAAGVGQPRDGGLALVGQGVDGVDQRLGAELGARAVEALRQDALAAAVGRIVRDIGDHEAAAGRARHRRVELGVVGHGVDEQLAADRRAGRVIALREHAEVVVAGVVLVARLPHHDEAAVVQRRDRRVALLVDRGRVDAELRADRLAVSRVALGEHADVGVGVQRVLVRRLPHHHPAAVGQHRHARVALRALGEGVGDAVAALGRRRIVRLGRDRHLDEGGAGVGAQPVRDVDAHPRRRGVVAGIGVAERADQRLDRLGGGGAVQRHLERRAVRPVAFDIADQHAVHAHLRSRDRDEACARVARDQPEPVLRRIVRRGELAQLHGREVDGRAQRAARREAAVQRRHRHGAVGVERDEARVHRRLLESHRAGQAGDLGRAQRREGGRVAIDLLEHALARAVARRAGGHGGEGHHEAAAGQRRHGAAELLRAGLAVDAELAVDARAVRGEDLRRDVRRTAARRILRVEGHDDAPVVEHRHVRRVLRAGAAFVDEELVAQRRAGGVEEPADHARSAAVLAAGVGPDHDKAVGGRRDRGLVLGARGHLVDRKLAAREGPVQVHDAPEHARGRPVARRAGGLRGPHHRQPPVGKLREGGLVLRAGGLLVDDQLGPDRGAVGAEALIGHAPTRAVAHAGGPGHREAAVGQRRDRGVELAGRKGGVDAELRADGGAGRVIALGEHARRIVQSGAVPDHDESAVGQPCDHRVLLGAGGEGVDAELRPRQRAVGGVALGEDAIVVAVLVGRGPDRHPAAVGQPRHLGVDLLAGGVGVDAHLGPDRGRAAGVGALRQVDADRERLLQRAVAVGQLHRIGAAVARVVAGVGVAQRAQHRLDPLDRRRGAEQDLEVRPRLTVRQHGPDRHAADAHRGAVQRHRACGRADRGQRHAVLRAVVGRQEAVLHGVGHQPADRQPPAVEIGRIRVGQADRARRRQQHAGRRLRLGEGDHARQPVHHRRRRD